MEMLFGYFNPDYIKDFTQFLDISATIISPQQIEVISRQLMPSGDDVDDKGNLSEYRLRYTIYGNGDIAIHNSFKFNDVGPRFGMQWQIPGKFKHMIWYGRGPWESYSDRKESALIGFYSGMVEDQLHDYVVPQENANKTDVRWVAWLDDENKGWLIIGDQPLSISAWPYTQETLANALHINKLRPFDKNLTINVDLMQMGVGGGGCGMLPHEDFIVGEGNHEYEFIIRAYIPSKGELKKVARLKLT
jgi:hypothetical protein